MAQTILGATKLAAAKAGISTDEYIAKVAAGLKRCFRCKTWQPVQIFNSDRSRFDGLSAKCHNCTRVAVRKSTKGRASTFLGRHHSPEAKEKLRLSSTGRPGFWKGKTLPLEMRKKISAVTRERAIRGPACHSYKDGKAKERYGIRISTEYKRWRYDVFTRDKFTCQECGDARGGNLNAHHIKAFADFPDLRLDVSNGITLCEDCHDKKHP